MIDPNEFTVSIFNGEPKLEKYIGNKETVVIPEEFKRIGLKDIRTGEKHVL